MQESLLYRIIFYRSLRPIESLITMPLYERNLALHQFEYILNRSRTYLQIKVTMVAYELIRKIARICHFVGAVILFLMAGYRFIKFDFTSTEFILCVYYVLFGLLIIFTELGFQFMIKHFFFMNYSFGKALFAAFVATLCYGTSYWVQLAVAIFFTVACAGFLVMGFIYTSEENEAAKANSPDADPKDPQPAASAAAAPAAASTTDSKQREMDNMKLPAPQV